MSITAVVLSYNKARVFSRFIRSLMRQTILPSQLIVVDDASTDGTQELIKTLPGSWTRLYLPSNRGQSYARNFGAEHATKDYIIFLDGDIEMNRTMLATMYHALRKNPRASIAYCHYNRAGTRVDHVRAIPWHPMALRRMNFVSAMSMIRRTDMPIPPFDEQLRRYEDWDLWIRMANAGRKGVLINKVLFTAFYTIQDLSGTSESMGWYRKVLAKHGLPIPD